MSAELKPCPWCGGRLKEGLVLEGETFRWRRVQGCCTDGPEVRVNTLSDDREEAEREARAQAYAAWNTRAPQWQSIESAPKDGTEVDLWHPKLGRITASNWDSCMERWTILCDSVGPTHFMMPPDAPEVQP